MQNTLIDDLVIIATEYDEVLSIRDELKKIDLFKSFSFDVGRMLYFVKLNPVNPDGRIALIRLMQANKYQLVQFK